MVHREKVNIYQIAQQAETSVGTVSNVINHPERVRQALRERVQGVMKRLNYFPNHAARSLSSGRSYLLGAIFFDISNPFFAEVAHKLDLYSRARGSSLLIGGTEQDSKVEERVIENLSRLGAEGIIVTSTGDCFDQLYALKERGIPVVLLAQRAEDDRFDSVCIDDRLGMKCLTEHLLRKGIENFSFVREKINAVQHRDRWDGFADALESAGIDPETVTQVWGDKPSLESGLVAVEKILQEGKLPECFVCLNDYIAIGVSQAVERAGYRVGRDVCVTGFDDIPYASVLQASLTTVRQPIPEMCSYITDDILTAIENGETETKSRVFKPQIIIRESA